MISAVSQRIWGTRIAWLLFAALIALFLFYGIELAHAAYLTAIFPGEFDYAEGIVWQQAKLIPGPRMYGDVQIYPYLVFHYPPFYHLVVHAAALLGIPWLMAGRLVSILSTVALGVIVAAFVSEATSRPEIRAQSRWAGAAIAGLLLVTLRPIQLWAYAMRVDLLAVMLEFLGMYLGLCALRRPNLTIPAALAFVLAVYTKQTMLAGAIATFVALLVQAPARAFRAAIFAVLLGGVIFAGLTIATKGGFPRHIILYNINSFSLKEVYHKLSDTLTTYPLYLLLALGTAAMVGARLSMRPLRTVPAGYTIALVYFILSAASLVSLGKSGAGSNYLVPWVSSWALLIGLAVVEIAGRARQRQQPFILALLFGALIAQALATPKFGDSYLVDAKFRSEYAEVVAMVAHANKPVFSEDMVVLMQAGKEVPWEPAIITELSGKHLFDERKIIDRIHAHQFAYMILKQNYYTGRYSPAVEDAIEKDYPDEQLLAGMRVLSPDIPDAPDQPRPR